jgi:hypothetical protein
MSGFDAKHNKALQTDGAISRFLSNLFRSTRMLIVRRS